MKRTNKRHHWVRFYPTANWQIVLFFTEDGKEYLQGFDWGTGGAHEVEMFDNKNYEVGRKIDIPG